MIVAVDAMGGDFAPEQIVKGAVLGSRIYEVDVTLVGDEATVSRYLPADKSLRERIVVYHASDAIAMDEHVDAVRTKKDASIVVAASLVKQRRADAMVSMGNTAACVATATLTLGRIPGIDRPAIATVLPGELGPVILLDAGAVADCEPRNLLQFAIMGALYADKVLGIANPRVALLSIGEEKEKGSKLTRAAYELLESSALNFVGNVEGRHLLSKQADVIVADGFAGNVALKAAEGLAEHVAHLIKDDLRKHPFAWLPVVLLLPMIRRIRNRLDYSEHGGAPLLGVDGVCIVGHGRSNSRAVANAIRAAKEAVTSGIVPAIRESMTVDV